MNVQKFAAVSVTALLLTSAANASSLLTNGGFETGDFTGWTATAAASSGSLSVTMGGDAPESGFAIPDPSEGEFYAVTDQGGPGAYSLMQSFVAAATMTLSFDFFAQTAAAFADLGTLDHTGDPNHHARVDILTAAAGAFDVGGSVVESLIAPVAGSSSESFASFSFDLSGLTEGTTYQLRFAQVDNSGNFQMGVDNVVLQSAAVPLPAAGVLLLGGIGLLGAARRRKARQS